jgi:hypothetical protein
VANG